MTATLHPGLSAPNVDTRYRAETVSTSLVWSEYCYLLCIALALVLCILPHDMIASGNRTIRHLPLLATVPLVILSIIGWRLSSPPALQQRSLRAVVVTLLPLLLMGAWIVVGSAHARFVEGLHATFLNMGVYMVAALAAALMMVCSRSPLRLAQAYLTLLVLTAIAMSIGLILVYGRAQMYHEHIFLLIPIAVACAIAIRQSSYAWLCSMFFIGTALLSQKNTSYLISLLTVAYIAVFLWLSRIERSSSVKRLWTHYLAFICVLAATAAACYVLYYRDRYLPSGNVEFRSYTYRAAWQQFTESPLWGTSFSAESVREFTLYSIGIARNRLPTHSDVMDLLANGGLLAMGLWLWAYIKAGAFAYRRILAPRFLHSPWAAQAHTFALISISAIIVYAFNPVMLQPELAYLAWTTFGFLVGLAASCDPDLQAGALQRKSYAENRATPSFARSMR
jgi:O-antigen ligase